MERVVQDRHFRVSRGHPGSAEVDVDAKKYSHPRDRCMGGNLLGVTMQ